MSPFWPNERCSTRESLSDGGGGEEIRERPPIGLKLGGPGERLQGGKRAKFRLAEAAAPVDGETIGREGDGGKWRNVPPIRDWKRG